MFVSPLSYQHCKFVFYLYLLTSSLCLFLVCKLIDGNRKKWAEALYSKLRYNQPFGLIIDLDSPLEVSRGRSASLYFYHTAQILRQPDHTIQSFWLPLSTSFNLLSNCDSSNRCQILLEKTSYKGNSFLRFELVLFVTLFKLSVKSSICNPYELF